MSEQTRPPVNETRRVEAAASRSEPAAPGWRSRAGEVRNLGLLAAFALLGVVGALLKPDSFPTRANAVSILTLTAVIGVVTIGMTFVIIGGGIDLSVGALTALASVWSTTLSTQSYGPWVMALCAVLVGGGFGLINGILIAYGRMVPFIVTLAMLASARGLAQRISANRTQVVTQDAITNLATNKLLGLPHLVWIFAVVAVIGWVVLNRTTYGRRTFAIGGNAEAARLAGIDVRRHTVSLYVVSGICCGIAAIMITAQTATGSSTHGDLYELRAIAAVIIGGTLLTGGRGTIVGSVIGILIFQTITNIFILNNLKTADQNIAYGAIIVIAVLLQRRGRQEST